ncbi:MAG: AraC family transcriptional regulator [Elusimicrobia bacterium]|nr:AraC family transcriptional regulator [Elusimicrobiota bacterium]
MKKNNSELLYVGRTEPYSKWKMPSHSHPFNEMIVVINGEMSVLIANQNIIAKAGDVLFYQAGAAHKEKSNEKNPAETIYFGWKQDNKEKMEFPILLHDTNGRMRLLSKWLLEERQTNSKYNIQFQESITETILAEYSRLNRTNKEKSELIRKIKGFMRDNLKENITLQKLADFAYLSKYHFLRKYKSESGRTPIEDLSILRIETAKELILTTNLPLKSIAKEVGFTNEYHFNRIFRKYSGLTPGHFRKNQ